jgi:hypothetical protein
MTSISSPGLMIRLAEAGSNGLPCTLKSVVRYSRAGTSALSGMPLLLFFSLTMPAISEPVNEALLRPTVR